MSGLLIVDDAMIMRKIIRDVAERSGWEVVSEAANGQEAVELYRRHRPALVTMDLVMPILGGLDALRQIRAFDPEASIVVVSALDQKQAVLDAIEAGALDFVVKPFEKERLQSLLGKLAQRNRPLREHPDNPT